MAEVQDTQNDSESQSSPMEDPTQIPKFTRQDIKKMKDQLLTLNLGKLCLDTTGSVNEKRQRLMDLFYPKNDSGVTEFHHAASVEDLQPNMNINPSSGSGVTEFHHAASVEVLQADMNINPSSGSGVTDFHHAASVEDLQPDMNINSSSGSGFTPLHHASIIEGITKEVKALKVGPLRDKLKSLDLDATGLKPVLRQRLLDHLLADSSEEIENETANLLDFQRQGSVIKQIPKASRIQAGKSFAEILRRVILKNDLESWGELFRFARDFFGTPNRGGKKRKSLATLINERLQGQQPKQSKRPAPVKKAKKKEGGPNYKTMTANKLKQCDIKGAIRVISSDDKILPVTKENRDKLEKKHPKPHKDTVMPEGPGDMQGSICDKNDVIQAIKSFKNGSAAGPDGFMPQFLKDVTNEELGATANLVLDTLVDFYNLIVFAGKIPDEVCEIFYGANLMGLAKDDGGVRPIAIGFALRRLAGKIQSNKVQNLSKTTFWPLQLGVGTSKGCEIAAHSIRQYVISDKVMDKVLVKVDFKNAFNSIRRDVFLRRVLHYCPSLYPMVYQCYSKASSLFFGPTYIIKLQEGAQQGDPLGPFLFSLAIMDLTKDLDSEVNLWYLDDGTLIGSAGSVMSDYKKIKDASNSLGLEVNPGKCEIMLIRPKEDENSTIAKFRELAPEIREINVDNLTMLGSPIMVEAINGVLQSKLESFQLMCERLEVLDPHDALFLLRHAFALPKLTYFLRTSPCFKNTEILKKYDNAMRVALIRILNVGMEDSSWDQCSLPVRMGGLGVRTASEVSLPAYLSSVSATFECITPLLPTYLRNEVNPFFTQATFQWSNLLSGEDLPILKSVQAAWDIPLCKKRFEKLLQSANTSEDKARLMAVSSEHASDWLNCVPLPSMSLKLNRQTLRIAVALRLGSTICKPHKCHCIDKDTGLPGKVDIKGLHGLSCASAAGKGRIARHDRANDLIHRALASANYHCILEPTGLCRDKKRPDGFSLYPYAEGKILAWDYTCRNTLADSYKEHTAVEVGYAAKQGEKDKYVNYEDLVNDNYYVVPIAHETMGSWAPDSLKFMKDLGSRISEATGEKRAKSFLFQSISMNLQRGNALCIMGTVGHHRKLDEIYNLGTISTQEE